MKTALLLAALAVSMSTLHAAQPTVTYPVKPIRMLVGPAAGGPTDAVARTVASKLTDYWGQQVVVENRPGAGNTIGASIAAKATPDGYTLLFCPISEAIAPALYKTLPYDFMRDFAAVGLVGTTPNALIVYPGLPVKTVGDFIALAKAKPGAMNYASTGVGISTHLSMELFKSMTSTHIVHVPYRGIALAMPDLFAGRVSAAITNLPGAIDPIKSGRVRALGVTTLKRTPLLPDLPTISEAGVPGYEVTVWYGVCAPAAVPSAIVRKLNTDLVHLLTATDLRQRLELQGVEPQPGTPDQFRTFIKAETAKWAKVVKEAGIEPR